MAIAWLPGPAGTRRRVAKLSVEEPDAAEPARPDLWGPGSATTLVYPTCLWHGIVNLSETAASNPQAVAVESHSRDSILRSKLGQLPAI